MNKKDFKDFNTEVILQVLAELDSVVKKSNDKEKIKYLNEKLIPKFEKLYIALRDFDIRNKTDEEIKKFSQLVLEIASQYNLTKKKIKELIKKREELRGKSGAEVTKKMFEFTMKELKNKKIIFQDRLKELLKDEETQEKELKDCIQYDDEIRVSANIVEIRELKRNVRENIEKIDKEIEKIKEIIEKSWRYLIFGTISKDELKNIAEYQEEKIC